MDKKFDYFLAFLVDKIDHGTKQVDIAEHDEVNKDSKYISRLYRGVAKSCPKDIQYGIASFFKLTPDEMYEQGRNILMSGEKTRETASTGEYSKNGRITDPEEQKNLLLDIARGIDHNIKRNQENREKTSKCKLELDKKEDTIKDLKYRLKLYDLIFAELYEGVTFFDVEKSFVFSTNRWGFLNEIDLEKRPNLDTIIIAISKKIKNIKETLDVIYKVHADPRSESSADVEFHTGHLFQFRIIPLFNEKEFLGTLLVNTFKGMKNQVVLEGKKRDEESQLIEIIDKSIQTTNESESLIFDKELYQIISEKVRSIKNINKEIVAIKQQLLQMKKKNNNS